MPMRHWIYALLRPLVAMREFSAHSDSPQSCIGTSIKIQGWDIPSQSSPLALTALFSSVDTAKPKRSKNAIESWQSLEGPMRTDILEMLDRYESNREESMFPEPETASLDFGLPLTEKHRPQRVQDFIGIQDAKAIFSNLIKRPRPCALLLLGAPGLGKTTLSLAFAKELNAGLIKVDSGQLTVDRVADIRDKIQYC